ncbi:hypothetical protein [Edwardsiella tarda]|uniref:hypothetical protein n=1 Tax=Edwardsiella tarda TaxID=636 RepID=UPI00351C5A25
MHIAIVTRQLAIGITQRQDSLTGNGAAILFIELDGGSDLDGDIGPLDLYSELAVGAECVKTGYMDGVMGADLPQVRLIYRLWFTEGGAGANLGCRRRGRDGLRGDRGTSGAVGAAGIG